MTARIAPRPPAILWVAAGAALWGTDTVLRRPLAEAISPIQLVFYEHLILAVVVGPMLFHYRFLLPKMTFKEWSAILGVSWFGSALATILFTYSIRLGNPTTAVLLQKLQPLLTILLARSVLGERWHRMFPVVVLISLFGAYLISFGGQNLAAPFMSLDVIASLLAIGAAAGWGSATVLGRLMAVRIPFPMLTGLRIVCALPVLALAAVTQGLTLPSAPHFLPLVLLALIPGFAALMLYYRGLQETPASLATIAELAFPATAALLNWMFLGMAASAIQLVGFAVVWSAIFYLRQKSIGGPV